MTICYRYMEKKTLELAEKICKKKFEEKFDTKFNNNDKVLIENTRSKLDILHDQISLWETLGQVHLSEIEIQNESPIKQGLYYVCKEKIKWCMNKIFELK